MLLRLLGSTSAVAAMVHTRGRGKRGAFVAHAPILERLQTPTPRSRQKCCVEQQPQEQFKKGAVAVALPRDPRAPA